MTHAEPLDNEIKLSQERYIVSKTDAKGIIEYGNDYFVEISGYSESELIGQPHNIVRHPDMPKVAFKLMWESLNRGKNFIAIVKNLAKDGSYYWVVTDFEPRTDPETTKIVSHTAFRKAVPQKAIDAIIPVYAKLLEIEKKDGLEASERYFYDFFKQNNTTYDNYISSLIDEDATSKFFKTMKKMFA